MANTKKTTKSSSRFVNVLPQTKRFKQPVIFAVLGLFIAGGAILVYASFAGSIPVVNTNADFWRSRIAGCEAGSGPASQTNYKASNGAGHYGAYQFDRRTWAGAVGAELAAKYPLPSDAPPEVQDQAFNATFARRGSQPWNASFFCWRTPELAYAPVAGFLPRLGPVAATPPPPAKNAYNVTVQGRVYVDNQLQAGVKLITCVNGVTTTTDKGGVFRFELPAGTAYCVRVNDGLPAGSRLLRTNNNPEHAAASSYESQAAAKNYYHDLWQFFTTNYSWDRNSDENVDFFYATP